METYDSPMREHHKPHGQASHFGARDVSSFHREDKNIFGMENNLPRNMIRSFPSTFQKLFKGRLFSRLKILHLFYSLRHSFKFFPSVSILHFACICWTIKLHDHWSICSPQDPQGPAWYLAPGRHSVNVYELMTVTFYSKLDLTLKMKA